MTAIRDPLLLGVVFKKLVTEHQTVVGQFDFNLTRRRYENASEGLFEAHHEQRRSARPSRRGWPQHQGRPSSAALPPPKYEADFIDEDEEEDEYEYIRIKKKPRVEEKKEEKEKEHEDEKKEEKKEEEKKEKLWKRNFDFDLAFQFIWNHL